MDNIVTGFPNIPLSITNPNVSKQDAVDKFAPFNFIDFIKSITQEYDPDTLAAYYNNYLNRWNQTIETKEADNSNSIIDLYRNFLKDISLNFSTQAEQRFLTQLDFNDAYDLQIAMSFFSNKIRDIVSYYKKKRELLHYSVTKSKVKGSNLGVEQATKDLVIEYLENRETAAIDYNIKTVKSNLSISLTEYFDNFSQYFNREPDVDKYGQSFIEYDPGSPPTVSIFLNNDTVLIQETFAKVATDLQELKETNQLFGNKRDLTKKFIGTDFFYLKTDDTGTPEIGKFFEADKPYANFLNQNYPSTASVFSDDIISERDLGFFKPINSSIVVIQGKRVDFFTKNKYPPNQLYVFPDPNLYTNNEGVLTFIVDTSRSVNNRSKGIAINQPNTDKESTSFLGYNSEIAEDRDLNTDLTYLYNDGYIDDGKKDLFGNIFGLVKDNNYYRSNIVSEDPDTIKSLVLNGYQYFDDLFGEGYDFNYSTVDVSTYSETKRSGLSSFTNGLVSLPLSAYYIFNRFFNPYQKLKQPSNWLEVDYGRPETLTIDADVKEGAYFMFSDTETLADPIRSGLSSFTDSADQFYFADLVEGGVSYLSGSTVQRALCDVLYPASSGTFSLNARLSGDNGVKNYDCGRFTDNIIFNYTQAEEGFDYRNEVYDPTTFTTVQTASESLFERQNHSGKIYVKNINQAPDKPAVKLITDALSYFPSKYNSTVCDQLSTSVREFDLLYSTLFIETSTFLVTEQTKYQNNVFISPITFTNYLTINTSFFDKVSNRLKVGTDVFFCRLVNEQLSLKDSRIYPKIYKYDFNEDTTEVVFPTTGNPAISSSCYFDLSDPVPLSVYIESGKPFLTYSSDNEQFNLGVLIKDLNKGPLLLNYLFEYTDSIKFLDTTAFTSNNSRFTYTFANKHLTTGAADLDNLSIMLSSQIPSITATHQIPEFAHTPILSSLASKISAAALIL
tara:strand:- start:26326 stop:29190 length:2865 start_codon:yes stop_codon:yes gene_type:complete